MAANGASMPPGTSLPELPSLDVGSALPSNGAGGPPFTPLGGGAVPLLVKMPDGERRQIELPPTATVRDLRAQLPDDNNWDLNFHGQLMRDDSTLANYNIPDAYEHAGGLLKMISDSGELDDSQKVEALNNACNIVASVSRGETDMERLISAALADNAANAPPPPNDAQQPSLREVRRGKRSFMSLNLSNLPPPTVNADRNASNMAPPTPSQLISKLSATRPDLYPPSTASRMLALDSAAPSAAAAAAVAGGTSAGSKVEPALSEPPAAASTSVVPSASTAALFNIGTSSPPPPLPAGNGEFKRVPTNTWFSEFARSIAPLPDGGSVSHSVDAPRQDDAIGDSEDEPTVAPLPSNTSVSSGPSINPADTAPVTSAAAAAAAPPPPSSSVPNVKVKPPASTASSGPPAVVTLPSSHALSTSSAPVAPTPVVAATATGVATIATNTSPASRAPLSTTSATAASAALKPTGAPQPKKRGRKRKNPELSEEERKALRQAQNRESAKQSRLRRKVMAAEYEKRVTTLEGENETLRDTVAALSDRLQFLQNLLTVSVQKRPPGAGGL